MSYLGAAVMMWLCCGIVIFTFCIYNFLVKLWTKGEFDYLIFSLALVIVLAQLAMNMAAENLMQEVRVVVVVRGVVQVMMMMVVVVREEGGREEEQE